MSGQETPSVVSVIIPTLEEEADIAGCLDAIAQQDYPISAIEVLLVDGCSSDRTRDVARARAADLGLSLRIFENPFKRTSTSLNVGLDRAVGDFVVRLDARSRVKSHYVRTAVTILDARPDVGVVGGAQVPIARSTGILHRGIARALTNRYATGLARYRRRSGSGPADTVWMGCFRTEEVRRLGGWSAEVALNEDWELNDRYRSHGQIVWFEGGLDSAYLPRADLSSLARQYFAFGRVKGLWWARGMRPAPRQIVLVAAPPLASMALVALGRRWGRWTWLAVPVGLIGLDAVGARAAAPPGVRVVSSAAIGTYTAAWWIGTVAGWVGEVSGGERRPWPMLR